MFCHKEGTLHKFTEIFCLIESDKKLKRDETPNLTNFFNKDFEMDCDNSRFFEYSNVKTGIVNVKKQNTLSSYQK